MPDRFPPTLMRPKRYEAAGRAPLVGDLGGLAPERAPCRAPPGGRGAPPPSEARWRLTPAAPPGPLDSSQGRHEVRCWAGPLTHARRPVTWGHSVYGAERVHPAPRHPRRYPQARPASPVPSTTRQWRGLRVRPRSRAVTSGRRLRRHRDRVAWFHNADDAVRSADPAVGGPDSGSRGRARTVRPGRGAAVTIPGPGTPGPMARHGPMPGRQRRSDEITARLAAPEATDRSSAAGERRSRPSVRGRSPAAASRSTRPHLADVQPDARRFHVEHARHRTRCDPTGPDRRRRRRPLDGRGPVRLLRAVGARTRPPVFPVPGPSGRRERETGQNKGRLLGMPTRRG